MHNREEITAELTGIVPSAVEWPVTVPYRVPAGYFDHVPGITAEHVASEIPVYRRMAYHVPGDYFITLPGIILQTIRQQEVKEELDEVAPLLNSISKINPYSRPEMAMPDIKSILQQETVAEAKVVAMPQRKQKKWLQYAAAAVIAGVLMTIAVMDNHSEELNLSNVDQYAQIDVHQEMSRLSEDELSSYLNTAEKLVVSSTDRDSYAMDELPDVNDHIEMMSDDDLNQYLNESAESVSGDALQKDS